MQLPHPKELFSVTYPQLISRGLGVWHRGAAWILGTLLVGFMAVCLAMGGEQVTELHSIILQAAPYSPLLFMPAGFPLLAI